MPTLFATSDLHVTHDGNGPLVDQLVPDEPSDWLLVAGDVAERMDVVLDTLATLRTRFAKVVWVPGNHELWTPSRDDPLRGRARYEQLVAGCRERDVLTPEDEFPVWWQDGRPLTIAPLFQLYDYSWRTPDTVGLGTEEALRFARAAGVVCSDEYFLHPEPFNTRAEWCAERVAISRRRLDAIPPDHGTILLSHWPLHRHPTAPLYWPEFAMWCGTTETEDWHVRYRAELAVFGHLHIPRTTYAGGVPFVEVSLGYPREWRRRASGPRVYRPLLRK